MRLGLHGGYEEIWGTGLADGQLKPAAAVAKEFGQMSAFLRSLQPTNDSQRPSFDLSSQHFGFIEQTRLLTALQQASPISWPLLDIVVAWALILFLGYGLLSKLNATVIATLVFGASLVAGAIMLG